MSPFTMFGGSELGRFAKFLLTLTNSKWPLGVDPGGHRFVVLTGSINKKSFFLSPMVVCENTAINGTKHRIFIGYNDRFHAQIFRALGYRFASSVEVGRGIDPQG